MKNSILNLGKILNKTEQQTINGGRHYCPDGTRALVGCVNGKYIGFCSTGTIVIYPQCP